MRETLELLEYNNKRLEKRCAHLMTEMQQNDPSNVNGNSTSGEGFLAKIGAFPGHGGNVSALKQQIEVLQEELQAKIMENENVHIQMFELKQEHQNSVNRMEQDISQLMEDLQARERIARDTRNEMDQLRDSFHKDRNEYQTDVFKLQEQLFRLRAENTGLHHKLNRNLHERERLEQSISLRVPFDDIQHETLNIFNCPPHNRRLLQKHLQFQNYSKNSLLQLGKLFTALWATVLQKIAIVNNYADSSSMTGSNGGGMPSLSSDGGSSHSYSPIIHFLHNHMQNNNEKIDVENQHFCSELSSQFDFLINGLNAFIDFKSLNLFRIYEYRQNLEKLLNMLAQYLQFVKHSMLYVVVSLQESKCSSKRQFGQNYVQFENIYMDESTELTKNYQQFALYMDEFVDYFTDSLIVYTPNGAPNGSANGNPNNSDRQNTSGEGAANGGNADDETVTRPSARRKKRTKSVFALPKRKRKSIEVKVDAQSADSSSGSQKESTPTSANTANSSDRDSNSTPRSRSMSNFFDTDQQNQLIIDNYITADGTNPSPPTQQSNHSQKKDVCLYLKGFCAFLKQFSRCIEAAIQDEHKLDFISSSIKSSNEKVIHFFSMIVSLVTRFHEYLQEYKQVEQENMAAHVRGYPVDPQFWDPIVGKQNKELIASTRSAISDRNKDISLKQPPYNLMANDGRAFMKLLDVQFQEDARSFDNISHSTALENRREIEHLHNEREHFENLTKKYKNSINEMIQHLRDVVTELSDGTESVESPAGIQHNNTLVEQEEKFEFYLQKVVDLFEEMQENLREEIAKEERSQPKEESKISEEIIERENRMKKEYEKIVRHLEKQIKICDSKAVDFRIDWQKAVVQLEEAYRREQNLTFKVSETKQLLQKVQDELHTTRENYERQNQMLTNSLLQMQQEKKTASSGFSLEGLWSKK